jgi:hypothetical protein
MAIFRFYDHTSMLFASGQCPPTGTYKMLLLNGGVFSAAHTTKAAVIAASTAEVYNAGYGWPQGGVALTDVTCDTVTTNDAAFDAADVLETISGGALGEYDSYIIYADDITDDPPLAFVELTAPITVADGGAAGAIWSANGIIKFTVT